jgi:hypothetical protein
MALSEILANVAKAKFDRNRQIEADAKALADKAARKNLWDAFNKVCDFVPHGPADQAARTWAALHVCRLACAGDHAGVKNAVQTLLESAASLDSPFRLFLECVRDNRRW